MKLLNPEVNDPYYQKMKFRPVFHHGILDLRNLISTFQNLASEQIERLHLGEEFEKENNCSYVVLRYKGTFLSKLKEEEYTLVTYPVNATALTMYRYAYLLNEKGDCVFTLTSLWVLMNKSTRKIIPARAFRKRLEEQLPKISMVEPLDEERLDNFSLPDGNWSLLFEYCVKKEDIDSNGHMNNAVYFSLAQKVSFPFSSFELDYEKECFLGEKISLFSLKDGEEGYLLGKKGEEISFKIRYLLA